MILYMPYLSLYQYTVHCIKVNDFIHAIPELLSVYCSIKFMVLYIPELISVYSNIKDNN